MLKAIHAQEDREAARQKADALVVKLRQMKLKLAQAAQLVRTWRGKSPCRITNF
jgi:hypothetical protein